MARRRSKVENVSLGIIQLLVLIIGAFIFLPPLRHAILDIGLVILSLALTLLAAAVAIKLVLRRRGQMDDDFGGVILTARSPDSTLRPQKAASTLSTQDIIRQLREIDWFQFEKVVAITYRKLGYTVTRRGGANPDGGIDLVIERDGERTAVQCKHWKTWKVGVKAVREFLGALTDANLSRGIFVTLGGYTGDAKALAEKRGIEILNDTALARMLESLDAKYDPEVQAALQDTRKLCPRCKSEMVLRTAKKGAGAGGQFWGCSAYPRCQFTMKA
jgi:restriction system protein